MNFEELTEYFEKAQLPQELRLDRATTQLRVADQVKILLANMKLFPDDWRHEHRLLKIKNAIENPYNGPGIPKC